MFLKNRTDVFLGQEPGIVCAIMFCWRINNNG